MATPRIRPASPMDGFHIKDDFAGVNDAVTDAAIGELLWEIEPIGNASTYAFLTQMPYGVLRQTTANTADGDGSSLRTFTDGLVLDGTSNGGGFAFRARLTTSIANSNFRIGLDDSVTATDPGSGIVLTSDGGVMSLKAFSNDHGDATVALDQPGDRTLTSGTTMVVDTWHTFEVNWIGANGQGGPRFVEVFVDGDSEPSGSVLCNLDNDEEVEAKIVHWQDSGGAAQRILDIDYFEAWNWR